jgi:hypothetical protein
MNIMTNKTLNNFYVNCWNFTSDYWLGQCQHICSLETHYDFALGVVADLCAVTPLYAGLLLGILKASYALTQTNDRRGPRDLSSTLWRGLGQVLVTSFSSCTPLALWNSLPQRLKQSQNVDIFKRRLKMWLFNDHFGGVVLWSIENVVNYDQSTKMKTHIRCHLLVLVLQ